MKRSLILLASLALAGCSSLNVSWQFTASYGTSLQVRSLTEHGLEAPTAPAAPAPAPIAPGKPS